MSVKENQADARQPKCPTDIERHMDVGGAGPSKS